MRTAVLCDPRLVESAGAEPQIQRADCKVLCRFSSAWESEPLTSPHPVVHRSNVIHSFTQKIFIEHCIS